MSFGPSFFLGALFGIFGMGYFAYGKKQGNMLALGSGLGLMLFPYFVSDIAVMTLAGLALMAAPFAASRFL
ncbi:MAG: hypothetical protein HZA04_09530 [Nitrospinae bacterium]|nr:hypothetical protein [Nitrospinota bacterium]